MICASVSFDKAATHFFQCGWHAFVLQYDKSSVELQQLHNCLNEIVSLWGSPWISALDSFPFLRVC